MCKIRTVVRFQQAGVNPCGSAGNDICILNSKLF